MTWTATKLYKVLGENGEACHGGNGQWHLPKGKRPGKWMPAVEGELKLCANGYHVLEAGHIIHWLGPRLFEVEHKGEIVRDDTKCVVRQARLLREIKTWNEKTARLFAADCTEHVLFIYERDHPNDPRPRQAIEAARAFARGEISQQDLAAARDAAGDAAGGAAWGAAWAAAWAAARDAARDAAWAAARDAAWAAARAAAGAAEREWQNRKLMEYLEL